MYPSITNSLLTDISIYQRTPKFVSAVFRNNALIPYKTDTSLRWTLCWFQSAALGKFQVCISVHSVVQAILVTEEPFLELPGNVSGQESCFMLAIFPFKIEFSCILKMIQWSYQWTKQNCLPICIFLFLPYSFGIFSILLSFHLSSPVSIAEKRTARLQYWFKLTPPPPPIMTLFNTHLWKVMDLN